MSTAPALGLKDRKEIKWWDSLLQTGLSPNKSDSEFMALWTQQLSVSHQKHLQRRETSLHTKEVQPFEKASICLEAIAVQL